MFKMIVNLGAKLTGLSKLWEKASGYKAYVGGASALLMGAAQLLEQLSKLGSPADFFEFAKNIHTNPAMALISMGLIAVGLRHSDQKIEDKIASK